MLSVMDHFSTKWNEVFSPRRKRFIKFTFTLFTFFLFPLWVILFGASFTYSSGKILDVLYDITDLRVQNISMRVLQNGDFVAESDLNLSKQDILEALPFSITDYILNIDIENARQSLLRVPWVKKASVKIQLPDHIIISLEENTPFALWQNNGQFYLIDKKGNIITDQQTERYDYLPWVVGKDANRFAREYVLMMQDFSDIFSGVKASYRVGKRRWTLLTHNNIKINLSETNPRASLERLVYLQKKYNILEKEISAIDLQIPSKVFLRKNGRDRMELFYYHNQRNT